MTLPTLPAEAQDFDFFIGRWTVRHRRLRTRGIAATDWDTFASVAECRPLLGGVANVEEQVCADRGWRGAAVRCLDLARREWSIYWISDADGRLQPPVRGRFEDGVGVFEGPDVDGDRPILARYTWTRPADDAPQWSQAFSYDGGATWEMNWIMDFTRRPD